MDFLNTALPYVAENYNCERVNIVAVATVNGSQYLVGVQDQAGTTPTTILYYENGCAVGIGFGHDLCRIVDHDADALADLPDYIRDAARELLKRGAKISAVKLVRSACAKRPDGSSISLTASKEYVEALDYPTAFAA